MVMTFEWIAVEIIAILAETAACIYFLYNRYNSKYNTITPEIICASAIICWGLIARFAGIPGYDYGFMLMMFAYVFFTKYGRLLQKFIGVILLLAIMFTTSMVGASIAVAITGTNIRTTLEVQDTSRLVAIIFIKIIQISLLLNPSIKHSSKDCVKMV